MCVADCVCGCCRREATGDDVGAAARGGGGHGEGAPVSAQGVRAADYSPGHQGVQHPSRRGLRAPGISISSVLNSSPVLRT